MEASNSSMIVEDSSPSMIVEDNSPSMAGETSNSAAAEGTSNEASLNFNQIFAVNDHRNVFVDFVDVLVKDAELKLQRNLAKQISTWENWLEEEKEQMEYEDKKELEQAVQAVKKGMLVEGRMLKRIKKSICTQRKLIKVDNETRIREAAEFEAELVRSFNEDMERSNDVSSASSNSFIPNMVTSGDLEAELFADYCVDSAEATTSEDP